MELDAESLFLLDFAHIRHRAHILPYFGDALPEALDENVDYFVRNSFLWTPRRSSAEIAAEEADDEALVFACCPVPGCHGRGARPMELALGFRHVRCATCDHAFCF